MQRLRELAPPSSTTQNRTDVCKNIMARKRPHHVALTQQGPVTCPDYSNSRGRVQKCVLTAGLRISTSTTSPQHPDTLLDRRVKAMRCSFSSHIPVKLHPNRACRHAQTHEARLLRRLLSGLRQMKRMAESSQRFFPVQPVQSARLDDCLGSSLQDTRRAFSLDNVPSTSTGITR
jgi:hypothetical protein